jgi:EmrB/QacA subfamily drug resistance transporter
MKNLTRGPANRWRGLIFLCLSLLVIGLDNTVVNVALPSISNQLGGSDTDLQWIVAAYILVFAALLLTIGTLSDRIGRKRVLQFGLLWLGAGSGLAALSPSVGILILSRALLGVGGAMILPSTLSLISATFLDQKEHFQAIAIWGAMFGVGGALGPLVGGLLLHVFDWKAVFLINLPVITVALLGGAVTITESRDTHVRPLDLPGVLPSILGLFALVYGIIQDGNTSWTDRSVLLAFGAALVLLSLFALWESKTPHATLPVAFFKNRAFSAANAGLALVMFALFGSLFFLSQYLQSVQGYSALAAGVHLLPMALVVTVVSILSARLSSRLGLKITVGGSMLLAAVGLFFLSRMATVNASYTLILLALIIFTAGLGLAMPPATAAVIGAVPTSSAGIGSAMNNTVRQVGAALGVVVLGSIMNSVYLSQIARLRYAPQLAHVPAQVFDATRLSVQQAHVAAHSIADPRIAQMVTGVANQAFISGMAEAMLVGALILAVAAVLTLAILPVQVRLADDHMTAPETTGDCPEQNEKSEALARLSLSAYATHSAGVARLMHHLS